MSFLMKGPGQDVSSSPKRAICEVGEGQTERRAFLDLGGKQKEKRVQGCANWRHLAYGVEPSMDSGPKIS